jgi:molecular chaperone IbpA
LKATSEIPKWLAAGCQIGLGAGVGGMSGAPARIHVAQTEDVAMRAYDFSPLWRSTVGFDRVFDLLNSDALAKSQPDYPPYNIERLGEDTYRVTLALAGFSSEQISIEAQQNLLTISGKKDQPTDREYLHQGIPERPFELRVSLEDHVEAEAASFENGLLHIDLVRRIPEAKKQRRIEIGDGSKGSAKSGRGKTVDPTRAG